ncbi:MAG: fibronectin type III domain-containing protein [Patescibacteria group bacterium]|nr:fibronectin type III domain-containing protein [Patescibacteria group bacterium]
MKLSSRIAFFSFLAICGSCLLITPTAILANYQIDTSFLITDNSVLSIAQDENYIYVGGEFRLIGKQKHNNNVIYNKTTNTIENFSDHPNGKVFAVAPDGNGGWYVGGQFDQLGTHNISNLVHIKPDKTINLNWTPNPNGAVRALYFDGTNLYVGGDFTQIGGQNIARLAKLNATTGIPNASWNPNPDNSVNKIIKDGSDIYVCGTFANIGGLNRLSLVKLNDTNGNVNTSWNPNPNSVVYDIAVSNSHVYAVGNFSTIGATTRYYAAKLNKTNGGADPTWHPNADAAVNTIALNLSEGEIYVGGYFTDIGGNNISYLAKLNDTNGQSNPSWTSTLINDLVRTIHVSGNTIYVGGDFNSPADGSSYITALSKSDATKLASWNFNFSDRVNTLAEQGQEIFIGGQFSIADGIRRNYLARFSKSTSQIDNNWNPNPNNYVTTIAVDNNAVYVGGAFSSIGGLSRDRLAKINKTNGNADSAWVSGLLEVNNIYSISLSDNHIYVGGELDVPFNLAKLQKTNGALASWYPSPDAGVYSVFYKNGNIYTGGNFTTIGSQSRNRIAKLNDNNGNALAWNPSANNSVRAIYPTNDGVFVGGSFTNIGGQSRNRIAKLNDTNGNADPAWNINLDDDVLAIDADENYIYFGGNFTTVNGNNIPYIAKATKDNASIDDSFAINPNNNVRAILIDTNNANKIYIGGSFTAIGTNNYIYHLSKITYTPPTSSSTNVPLPTISENKPGPIICKDTKPSQVPDLFQINTKDTTAKLHFTPVTDSDYYYISFSEKESAEEHGALVKLSRQGVQSYEVYFLKPNTTYYFKVRSQNGCMPGNWSSIMKAKTNRRNQKQTTNYYKYQKTNFRISQVRGIRTNRIKNNRQSLIYDQDLKNSQKFAFFHQIKHFSFENETIWKHFI